MPLRDIRQPLRRREIVAKFADIRKLIDSGDEEKGKLQLAKLINDLPRARPGNLEIVNYRSPTAFTVKVKDPGDMCNSCLNVASMCFCGQAY